MDLLFAALPIAFLIFVMTMKKGLPSTIAFALAALLTYAVRIWFFKTSPNVNLSAKGFSKRGFGVFRAKGAREISPGWSVAEPWVYVLI